MSIGLDVDIGASGPTGPYAGEDVGPVSPPSIVKGSSLSSETSGEVFKE